PERKYPKYVAIISPRSGRPRNQRTMMWDAANRRQTVKIAAHPRYLPMASSHSEAGGGGGSPSVPCLRSSAHDPMVMAGIRKSSSTPNQALSWSRLARLRSKNEGDQNAAIPERKTKSVMKT